MDNMEKNILDKARQYEKNDLNRINSSKSSFHVTAPVGWLNDPNGFSLFQDRYHLFFQYYPYDTNWGPMHWGHCTTEDFVKWEYLPAALAPDKNYDKNGCFSGSAIETEEGHVLVYTGVTVDEDTREVRQMQCISSGDGLDYKKWDCNPVISPQLITEPVSQADFRDPKIWKYDKTYYMVVGSCDEKKLGRIPLFSSEDLKNWNYEGMLARNDGSYGRMWECPDFFEVDGTSVLITSPQDMRKKEFEFHNGNGTIYFAGDFDYQTCEFHHGEARAIDYGLDFYAPQTTMAKDGRRIMIAWMQSWDNKLIPEEYSWNGMMTLPRELHIKDGRLIQTPVRELEKYYVDKVEYEGIELSGITELKGIFGRRLNLEMTVTDGEYDTFEIQFAKNQDYMTTCRYEAETGIFTFDRSNSNIRRDVVGKRSIQVKSPGKRVKIQMILDQHSAEIFINDGEMAMTSVFITPMEAEDITFLVNGSLTADIIKNEICICD